MASYTEGSKFLAYLSKLRTGDFPAEENQDVEKVAKWMSACTHLVISRNTETFLNQLKSGVVMCLSAQQFSAFKFNNPPRTEAHRRENFVLFATAIKNMRIRITAPQSSRTESIENYVPFFLELIRKAPVACFEEKRPAVCVICGEVCASHKEMEKHVERIHANYT